MATSRFIQAAVRALDHTVQNNPNCVCSIDFKNSQILPFFRINNVPEFLKNTEVKHYKVTIKIVDSTKKISKVIYKIHRSHQRWWFRIIEETELDEFIEIDG